MMVEEPLEPAFGPDGHPDAVTLAGLDLDVFDAETTARIQAHLRDCATCRATLASVRAVPAHLAELPAPRMPDDVADRISAALRAEARARSSPLTPAAGPAAGSTGPAGPASLDRARERRQARRTRWMGLAAAGVAVLAAGGIAYGVLANNSTSGHGSAEQSVSNTGPGLSQNNNPGPDLTPPVYTRKSLNGAVPSIIQSAPISPISPANGKGPAGAMTDPARRNACVRALGRSGGLLAVQHARFEGTEAYVFVFQAGAHRADAYVVGTGCGPGGADQLYHTTASY